MDPPSENGFTADVCSSPISQHPTNEASGFEMRVDDLQFEEPRTKKTQQSSKNTKKVCIEDDDNIEMWSPAKRQSWESRKTNPNAFYYRHVEPGQVKRTGAWDQNEKEAFMKAIKLHPPTQGKWGLFAMNIPGRVGYQCRNFYHRLLEAGELREDVVPGEFLPQIKHRVSAKQKKAMKKKQTKQVTECEEEDTEEGEPQVGSVEEDKDEEHESIVSSQEQEIEETQKTQNKVEFQISSLNLFSTRLLKQYETEKTAEADSEEKEETIDEIGVIEDSEASASEIVEAAVETIERIANPPELLQWSPRMRQPWKTIHAENTIVFPHDKSLNSQQFEYQSTRIIRCNSGCPLNFLLLSFPAPANLKNQYLKNVRELLANNEEKESFTSAINAYFRAKKECLENPEERNRICTEFATSMINGDL